MTQLQAVVHRCFNRSLKYRQIHKSLKLSNCPIVLLQCPYRPKRAKASDKKPANTAETVLGDLCLERDQGGKGEK